MKKLILILLCLNLFIGCTNIDNKTAKENTKAVNMSEKEREEDFLYLYKILDDNFPYFEICQKQTGINWRERKERYLDEISKAKDDAEYLKLMGKVISELGDGHTNVLNPSAFGGFKKEIIRLYNDEPKYQSHIKPWYDIIMDEENEKKNNYWKSLITKKGNDKTNNNEDSSVMGNNNQPEFKIIEKNKTAYAKFPTFWGNFIERDADKCYEFWKSIADYEYLMIDIRGNGGGSDSYWMRNIVELLADKKYTWERHILYKDGDYVKNMIKAIGIEIKDIDKMDREVIGSYDKNEIKYYSVDISEINPSNRNVGFKGKIILLVDRWVYSSSEGFAAFAKSYKFAQIAGENTGGDGGGYTIGCAKMPNSGLVFTFPWDLAINNDGTISREFGTKPDIEIGKYETLESILEKVAKK